jgi:pimeloyl-ACP methyl ester carboxylesterase
MIPWVASHDRLLRLSSPSFDDPSSASGSGIFLVQSIRIAAFSEAIEDSNDLTLLTGKFFALDPLDSRAAWPKTHKTTRNVDSIEEEFRVLQLAALFKLIRSGRRGGLLALVVLWVLPSCGSPRRPLSSLPREISLYRPFSIVVGFVGFIDRPTDPRLSVVQVRDQVRKLFPVNTYAEVFRNREKGKARHLIFTLLDSNSDGIISDDERRNARIILYGHSWGASTAVALARDLEREHIPVLLLVEVDRVHKPGLTDRVIPANVEEIANFYQSRGLLRGRADLVAENPLATRVVGNFRVDAERANCSFKLGWFEKLFAGSHLRMQCDRTVWSLVDQLISQRLRGCQQ